MPLYKRLDELDTEIDLNEEIVVPDNATPEEKTFAKRYADLRRFMSSKEKDWQAKEHDYKVKLQNSSALTVPNADDEAAIDQWITDHPQIARIVMGLADRRAAAVTDDIKSRVQQLDEREKELKQNAAYTKIEEKHPDFFTTIRDMPEFHDWLGKKSKFIQDVFYGDDNDWKTAIDIITLFKNDNGLNDSRKPKTTSNKREDVSYTPTRTSSTPASDKRMRFSESQINKMSPSEYERYEDAITEAWRAGEVVRDMTDGVR